MAEKDATIKGKNRETGSAMAYAVPASLDGSPEAKLRRAERHVQELRESLRAYFTNADDYQTKVAWASSGEPRIKIVPADEAVLTDWSCMIGDAVQNYRAALDHQVWSICETAGSLPSNEAAQRQIGFPIIRHTPLSNWNEMSRRKLPGAPPKTVKQIEEAQPGFPHLRYPFSSADDNPLWWLKSLSNIDKHRRLPIVAAVAYVSWEYASPPTPDDFAVIARHCGYLRERSGSPPGELLELNPCPRAVLSLHAFATLHFSDEEAGVAGKSVFHLLRHLDLIVSHIVDCLATGSDHDLLARDGWPTRKHWWPMVG